MTDMNPTVERIKSANPVPSHDSLPGGAASATALLARIDERSTTMTDTLTPIREIEPSKPPRWGRGPLIALAVAAVVVLLIGVASFSLLSGDEQPVVTERPAPTTTTESPATTTTVASLPQSPLPADTPALEVVAAIQAEWDAGDISGAEALILPDSLFFTEGVGPGVAREIWYRYATGMTVERECEMGTPPQLASQPPQVPGSEMVTCTETLISGLNPGVATGGGTVAASVIDGWVVDIFIIDYQGGLDERGPIADYRTWLQETIPDRYPDLFSETTLTIIVETPQARQGHRELVPFFVADTGPRPERALPADTPLMDVVAEFHRRWDAGDVEGYETLIHPAIGYPPGNDAWSAWFGAVTGLATERTCTEVDEITVRCREIGSSDFVRGEVELDTEVEYVARNGWILAISFPDGSALVQPNNAAGVAEYRRWVQDNDPDAFAELFSGGIVMRLETPELRALHQEKIAEYLAATS